MPSVPPPSDPLASTPFRGIVVLVLGNDLAVLAITQQMLERLGASSGGSQRRGGLRAALGHRPHLILIDLDMPHMGGFELARHLRQESQLGRTRLVALHKPVTEQALVALARHLPGG